MTTAEDPARWLQAADEAFGRWDIEAVVAHLSAAVRGFTASGATCEAAMACVRLGDTFATGLGNLTASRAWYARAQRLLADEPPCLEQGVAAIAAMGCDVDDPAQLLASAELALDRARRFHDVSLETKALADAGLAHVQAGRIGDGMALLDEAMALACGPANNTDMAFKAVCSFFTACYFAADFDRAGSWTGLLRQVGLIGLTSPPATFLSSHCDSVQATLLVELGRWGEAEAVLERARAEFASVMPGPSWHPDIALADLRVRQGRIADAEALLLGKDQALQALLPAARLHFVRGDHELARATVRRGLRAIRDDRLRAVELLTVLVDLELATGDIAAAEVACADLAARASALDVPALQARTAAARARVLAATGHATEAIALVEATVDGLDGYQLPWLRVTLGLELARLLDAAGDPAGAALEAQAATSALAGLDVVLSDADIAVLERGAAPAAAPATPAAAPTPDTAALTCDGKWWTVSSGGTSARLPDTKGLQYLADLVAHPQAERHALDLVDRVEGVDATAGIDRRSLGDAGSLMDARARTAYRRRIEELRAEADDALADGRFDAVETAQDELDQLVGQLAQAFGLGGRDRKAASAAERARLNVTRAIRAAIGKVEEVLPGPGGVLDRRIRTGLYCAFEPAEDDSVRWIVQSGVNGTGSR